MVVNMIDYKRKIINLNGYIKVLLNSKILLSKTSTEQEKEKIYAKIQSAQQEINLLKQQNKKNINYINGN